MSHGSYRPFDLSTPLPGFAPPTCSRGVATVAGVAAPRLPWAAGIEQLRVMPCPGWLPASQWERLVFVALELSRTWGAQAHALGWTEIDLFGCHTQPWKGRIDRNGLALSLAHWRGPIRVAAITDKAIALHVDHGQQLRFYHFDRAGSVPLWIGYAQEGGP